MTEASGMGVPVPPLREKVLIASLWATAIRWGSRFLGLISVAVLARLLTPEDFGVIAGVMAIVAVINVLAMLGIDWALIQNHQDDKALYDTAWTLRLIKNLVVAALILISTPFAARYTDDPRVIPVMWVLAAGVVIAGMENIGVTQFRKELDFRKEFLFLILPKAFTVVLSIVAALILRSYWAIVVGIIGNQLLRTLTSYLMHPMRPLLSLSRFEAIWSFSRWMVLFNIGDRLFSDIDRLFLAGLVTKEQLAFFTVGSDVTSSLTSELVLPVNMVLMPGFAKLKRERERLRHAYIRSAGLLITLTLPIAVGVSSLSEELTLLLLGNQWLPAAPIIEAAAMAFLFSILVSIGSPLLLMVGLVRPAALIATLFAVTYIAAIFPVFSSYGILGLIALKGALSLLRFVWQTKVSFRYIGEPLSTVWKILQRPVLATLTMYLAIATIPVDTLSPLLVLPLKVALGAVVFAASLLILWRLSGRPDGVERLVLEMLNGILSDKLRLRTRSR